MRQCGQAEKPDTNQTLLLHRNTVLELQDSSRFLDCNRLSDDTLENQVYKSRYGRVD